MLDRLREAAGQCLEQGVPVLGLKSAGHGVLPHLFMPGEDTAALAVEPKWPLARTALDVLRSMGPGAGLAVVGRGCDERALNELRALGQIAPDAVRFIGYACTRVQAEQCRCREPYPERLEAGDKVEGVDPMDYLVVRRLVEEGVDGRSAFWRDQFAKCIKCLGCRNACPICVCPTCRLEDGDWVEKDRLPPEPLAFQLIRAFHLADHCVACGACQEACPMDIPLLALQQALRLAVADRHGHEPGRAHAGPSPLLKDFHDAPQAGMALPAWIDDLGPRPGPEAAP